MPRILGKVISGRAAGYAVPAVVLPRAVSAVFILLEE